MRKAVSLATRLPSFAAAAETVLDTLEIVVKARRIDRLAERIGQERVAERAAATSAWESLPLMEKLQAPRGIKAPAVVCVSCDGGRMQRCDLPEDAKSHWCETKVGVLLELKPAAEKTDPCPQVPDKFLDLAEMDKVTRDIKGSAPKGEPFARRVEQPQVAGGAASATVPGSSAALAVNAVAKAREPIVAKPPEVLSRDVAASLTDGEQFGRQLAAAAWSLGFSGASRKAFIADGSSTNWGIWQREFKHQEYVPILDFIHGLTYVFSAAMAGRTREEGAPHYRHWITWIWQGQTSRVIGELQARSAELGEPSADAAETDPRRVVLETLTYLTNQQLRMNYPQYRRDGLPITSSHIESTVKQINQRVKGSEKFWGKPGGEALLQLRADQLCDTEPMHSYWTRRAQQATGTRTYSPRERAAA